jgi:hypothetical protein
VFKSFEFYHQNNYFMKKRMKHQMDPKKIQRFHQAMAVAKEILLEIVADATTDASSSGQHMGTEGGWVYVQRGYNAAEKFPKLYDRYAELTQN